MKFDKRGRNMTNYLKFLSAILVLLMLCTVFCLSGCGREDETPTQGVTEAPTEAPTQGVTETPTQGVTEAPTQGVTEAPTQGVTETPTQGVTETPTQGVTEAPTQGVTEAPTEAPSEDVTEAPTEAPTEEPSQGGEDEPVDEKVEYTVIVKDTEGNPIADAKVQICKGDLIYVPVLTDAEGKAVYKLEESDEYKGRVIKADGYVFSEWFVSFGTGKTELVIVLEAEAEECVHNWKDATCTEAKTCSVCGETEGTALGHTWADATCTTPKTCSVCNVTEGIALGHTEEVIEGSYPTCTEPGLSDGVKCKVCGEVIKVQKEISALGHREIPVAKVDPTCTTVGLTAGTKCLVCEQIVSGCESIPMTEHTKAPAVEENKIEATCSVEGSYDHVIYCSACETEISRIPVALPATGAHEYTKEVEGTKKPATCVSVGTVKFSCTCGATQTQILEIDEANHIKIVTDAAVTPDCTSTGLTEGSHCDGCKKVIKAQVELPILPHVLSDATCESPKKCEICGEFVGDALGHTWTEADCTTPKTCSVCDATEGEATGIHTDSDGNRECDVCGIEMACGHSNTITLEGVEPSCTETGLTEGKRCLDCLTDIIPQDIIPVKEHSSMTIPGIAADCKNTGLTEGAKCSVCGKIITQQQILPVLGHKEETIPGIAPTCLTAGYKDGIKCSVCGEILTAQEEIPALGHTDEAIPGALPTCTEVGLTSGIKCLVCGEILTAQESIPALGHTWADATCTEPKTCSVCGNISGNALGHKWDDADCVTPKTCSVCGATEGTALGHTWGSTYGSNVGGHWQICDVCEELGEAANHTWDNGSCVCGYACVHNFTAATCTTPAQCAICGLVSGGTEPHSYTYSNCTSEGVCVNCGDISTEILGHMSVIDAAVDATCNQNGLTEGSHCERCGEILVAQEVVSTLDHEYGDDDVCDGCGYNKPAPPCVHEYINVCIDTTCKLCGAERTAPGHVYTVVEGKPATCTEDGYKAAKQCVVCDGLTDLEGNIIDDREVIPATGHTWTEADCTTPKTCSVCNATEGSALGHTWTAANCITPKTCSACGATDGEATGIHTDSDGNRECDVCRTEIACEHSNTITLEGVEPSCTETGLTEGKRCSVCGGILVAQEEIPALGHTEETVPGKAATCTEAGLTDGTKCSVCGETLTSQEEIPALGHTEETVPGKAATCTETGLTDGTKCSVCGEILTARESIPASGHTWADATCTEPKTCSVCGETEGDALGHTWTAANCTSPKTCSVCNVTEGTALGHTEETIPGKTATCSSTGLTDGKICTVCGIKTVAQQTIPTSPHATSGECDTTCNTCGGAVDAFADHTTSGACDTECNVCGEQITNASGHKYVSDCSARCSVCGEKRSTAVKHNYGIKTGMCTNSGCGVANEDYAHIDNVYTMQEAYDYESPDEEYLLAVPGSPDANVSFDGYIAPGREKWINTGENSTPWNGETIRVSSTAEKLDINFFGWVAFGDFALEEFGVFVDELTSVDDIIYNANAGNHLDMYNGTGPLVAANMSNDIINYTGCANARRYCMALFNTNAVLWNELKTQTGEHTLHIVAKLEGGYYVVVQSITINVVEHVCKFPAEGTTGVGTVTAPTCTEQGYTTVGCTVTSDILCAATKNINVKPALGHSEASGWTYDGAGKHYHACNNGCGTEFDSTICSGADGQTCDICGGIYNCVHQWSSPSANGTISCSSVCGASYTPSTYVSASTLAGGANASGNSDKITNNGDYVTLPGNVTQFQLHNANMQQYVVVKYRATADNNFMFTYYDSVSVPVTVVLAKVNGDGEWHTVIMNMNAPVSVSPNKQVYGMSGDWNAGGKTIDIGGIATFTSINDAERYANILVNEDCTHSSTLTIPGVAATCTSVGRTDGEKCAYCGQTTVEQTDIPMIAHSYSSDCDVNCNSCGVNRETVAAHTDTNGDDTCDACGYVGISAGNPIGQEIDVLMENMFEGNHMLNETLMFIDYGDSKQLLYTPTQVISVKSYDGSITYTEGTDYSVENGKIKILPGSSMPCITSANYYNVSDAMIQTNYNGTNVNTYWGEGDSMTRYQVNVEYTHSDTWTGFKQASKRDQFSNIIAKLEAGEDVTIGFHGDSITVGANSSGYFNTPPYQKTYTMLVVDTLARLYGYSVVHATDTKTSHVPEAVEGMDYGTRGTITYFNTAVGGKDSAWGVEFMDDATRGSVGKYINRYGCDLFVVAFGMNDAAVAPATTKDNIKAIVDAVYAKEADCDMLVVSTMVPNPNATNGWYGNQYLQEAQLLTLESEYQSAGKHCAVAQMTSVSQAVLTRKEFVDYTGNNINHPNDFFARVYAQTLIQTILGYENID